MTTIEIIDYPVFVKLGCFEVEKLHGQNVLVSIYATLLDTQAPGVSDDLSHTLDYGQLLGFIDETLANKSINLVETLLNLIGEGVINNFHSVQKVKVTVEKTILPGCIGKGGRVRMSGEFFQ